MHYSEDLITEIERQKSGVLADLDELKLALLIQGEKLDQNSGAREHLVQGAGRRIAVIKRAIENIFRIFPIRSNHPLTINTLEDIQINLHALLINLGGVYDNWAWAYVSKHELEDEIGGRKKVGMFLKTTRSRLPKPLQDYLVSTSSKAWYEEYAKSYRDALAHRIPPYVPPATFTPEEYVEYQRLEIEKIENIKNQNWVRINSIWLEQSNLGSPNFTFLHSFNESTKSKPVMLHPQVLSDAMTVTEFGKLFVKHWLEIPTN
jgi:hypothetical protein